jgi:hypothetical protein
MEPQQQTGNSQNNNSDSQIKITPTRSGVVKPVEDLISKKVFMPVEEEIIPHTQKPEEKIDIHPDHGVDIPITPISTEKIIPTQTQDNIPVSQKIAERMGLKLSGIEDINTAEKVEEEKIIPKQEEKIAPTSDIKTDIPISQQIAEKIALNPNTGMGISSEQNQEQKHEEKISFRPENNIKISQIHTYADDIKNTVKDEGVSMVKIAMAEAKKQELEKENEEEVSPTSKKNISIILISLLVLIVGIASIAGAWYFFGMKKGRDSSSTLSHRQSIIPYDEEFVVTLDANERKKLITGIESAKKFVYDKNTAIVYIPVFESFGTTTNPINSKTFFSLLETRVPASLVRTFGEIFMFGFNESENQSNPFIIFTADSFSQIYAGMLEWEPAMADDIGDLFFIKEDLLDPVPSPIVNTASTTPQTFAKQNLEGQAKATTTSTSLVISATTSSTTLKNASTSVSTTSTSSVVVEEQKIFKSRYIIANSLKFKDEVLNNRDLRVLRTTSGKVLMYYTFINDKILLIAKDFKTLDEVVKRLATSQFKQ